MAERVYCLYRVSTSKQVDHDDQNQADIPMQRKACHDFADKMGWIIVGEEKETGVSGYKVSADDRDKLQLIKKYAEQGKFDILLVFMFDRLGRKSDETPFVVEWFAKKGVRVWSVKEGEQMAMIRSELQRARAENTKANKEYESLKAEVLKAIQGKSALPQDVLSEMLEDARQKVLSSSERITQLTAELNDGNSKIEEMKAEFNQIVSWSKIFDDSPMEVKKMICGYIIKKVSVCKDYDIKIEFNINVEQFLNGIDGVSECDTSELSIAQ